MDHQTNEPICIFEWASYTMTSTNFVKICGNRVIYGVESQDDEQAFRESCAVTEFFDTPAEWWTEVNFKAEQFQQIREAVLSALQRIKQMDAQI
ncbi:MAG: hypothetical protein HY774_08845 [Acidobacteria bacterium]|nr:hypothetical protein [Acidobacteriota bacterium]